MQPSIHPSWKADRLIPSLVCCYICAHLVVPTEGSYGYLYRVQNLRPSHASSIGWNVPIWAPTTGASAKSMQDSLAPEVTVPKRKFPLRLRYLTIDVLGVQSWSDFRRSPFKTDWLQQHPHMVPLRRKQRGPSEDMPSVGEGKAGGITRWGTSFWSVSSQSRPPRLTLPPVSASVSSAPCRVDAQ